MEKWSVYRLLKKLLGFLIIKTMGRIIKKQLVDPITVTGGYENQYQWQSQSIDLMALGLVEVQLPN